MYGLTGTNPHSAFLRVAAVEHGSLFDILHNETMILDAEIILPILQDMTQGMRFLHSSQPQVVHGHLKSQNILVDKNFRAKVADFGLSQRKDKQATGMCLLAGD